MTDLCSKVYCIYFSFLDKILFLLACCCSVAKSYSTLHNPMDCSTLGFPVLHHLSEFAQVFVHCITNAIKTSHPLSPSSPFAFNLSQHQSLFQWVGCSQQVAKYWSSASASVLPMNSQYPYPLGWTGLISLLSKGLSRVFSSTIWKHQFFGTQPSLWSNTHPYMTNGKTRALTVRIFVGKVISAF